MQANFVSSSAVTLIDNVDSHIGDSYTFNIDYLSTTASYKDFHPFRTGVALNALGCRIGVFADGVAGSTSAQMLARMPRNPIPSSNSRKGIFFIYAGRNDPDGPTTQANIISIGQAAQAQGFTMIVVGTQHYLNYASGGDTLAVQDTFAAATRTAQNAAAASLGATVADFYTFLRNKIVSGAVTQNDWAAWHVADSNSHLNATGQQYLADCIVSSIPANWITALQAA